MKILTSLSLLLLMPWAMAGPVAPLGVSLGASSMGKDPERPKDVVKLIDKKRPIEGRLVHISKDALIMRVKSKQVTIPRADVLEFKSLNEDLMSLMPDLRLAATSIASAGLSSLATTCADRNLVGEANLVWWSLLRLEPENEEAHTALGNKKSKGNWRSKVSGKSLPMDKLREHRPKWGKAFELSTTHFNVRSNLPWFETVRATLMAEEIYVALFQTLGAEFDMYWPSREIDLEFHADGSYGGGADLRATVDVESRRCSFDFRAGFQPWLFARHLNEMLVFEAIEERGMGRAALPLWMAIGLEESMQAILGLTSAESSTLDVNPDRGNDYDRSVHQGAKKPYKFTRVLNFGDGDFRNEKNELERAQAYTLFKYCLTGEGGKYRAGLMEYYARVLDGRASSTEFQDCLGLRKQRDARAFDAAWNAWAKAK